MIQPDPAPPGRAAPPAPPPGPPPAAPAGLADRLAAARTALRTAARRGGAGISTLRRHATRLDDLLRAIHAPARRLADTPHALIPLGGYGRRHQCDYSDIDLLIVFDGRIGAAEERLLRAILHPLWDLGLDVGQQVRQLDDFAAPETDNPEFLTALLDARFLAGDRTVHDRFAAACLAPGSPWRDPMRAALIDLVHRRHGQFSHTVFHLEPDVKDAPGGLRDAAAVRLLARLDADGPGGAPVDVGRLDEAEDFLLRVRSILHMERGRNVNLLDHTLQEAVARCFGAPGERLHRQVERLMSTYFHHAQRIHRSLLTLLKQARPAPAVDAAPTPIGDGLEQAWDGVRFVDATLASLQPRTWLRPFEAALDAGAEVSEQVLTCVERHGERYAPEAFFPTTAERDRLLRLLRPRAGLYDRLSEMHARGLLGRLFPEFQKIYCLVTRDFYHKYTVDEHTLRAIRNLEHLTTPRTSGRRRFAGLLQEAAEPELLVLALLFHDVGKWTNRNHAEEGVRMALGALRRIRLPEPAVATVEFLIRHHLRMSVVAFRRDVDDPETVAGFARLVGTEERLTLLCLLTIADVDAVGPDVMTPWKEEMLWHLYVETYNRLTLGYGDDALDAGAAPDALAGARPDDIPAEALAAFLDGLPRRYLRIVDPPRVWAHVRRARGLRPGEARPALEERGAAWELTTLALDRPGLFASICGVLSFFGMDILRGQAMSNRQGVAIDIVAFADREGYLRMNRTARGELTALLEDVVAGRADIDAKLRGRWRAADAAAAHAGIRTVVHFDHHHSRRFTVLEIGAANGWGLLYRLARTISACGCDIDLVLINTEGARALDVFHITKDRARLSEADEARLQAALERTLDGHDPRPSGGHDDQAGAAGAHDDADPGEKTGRP